MKSAVIVFPASNCDRDAAVRPGGNDRPESRKWCGTRKASLPDVDLVVLPGGFSYGDYLRCGAMANQSAVMKAVKAHAEKGGVVLGICNGFQVLTESGLLPGAPDAQCRPQICLQTGDPDGGRRSQSAFTRNYDKGQSVTFPVAHGEGNYYADDETLNRLEGEGRVMFRYQDNPNGSARDIAGILNEKRNVLGLMPHPERVVDPATGGTDGRTLFQGLIEALS